MQSGAAMPIHDNHSHVNATSPELETLALQLRRIYSAAVAAQLALRAQQAEQDIEIADTLRVSVCDPLGVQISALERSVCHLQRRRT